MCIRITIRKYIRIIKHNSELVVYTSINAKANKQNVNVASTNPLFTISWNNTT